MKAIWVFLVAACSVIAQQPRASVVVEPDVSASMRKWAAESRAEQREVVRAMPDGLPFNVMAVGTRVMPWIEAPLSAAVRDEVVRRIEVLGFADRRTDLAQGIDRGRLWLAGMPGRHILILLTDGQQSVAPDSPNVGRSFDEALNRAASEDPKLEVYIRIFGAAVPHTRNSRVQVYLQPPDWKALLGVPGNPAPIQPNVVPVFWTWDVAGAIAVAASFLLAFGGLALAQRHRRQRDIEAVTDAVEPELGSVAEPVRETVIRYAVCSERDPGHVEYAEPGSDQELIAGDSPLARLYLESAGANARFVARHNGLKVENCGGTPILVGRKVLAPGTAVVAPACYLELRLGAEIVSVTPEEFSRVIPVEGSEVFK